MKILSPPLEVIERNLFGPSEELLAAWADNDPSLPPDLIAALAADPEARAHRDARLAAEAKAWEETPEQPQRSMPAFLEDLIRRRQAHRDAQFSPKPRAGQILRVDEVIGPQGWDLPQPLAVLISEPDPQDPSGRIWSGWLCASETQYAGYWDLLLEPEDEPFDPLAGMVQIWNPVYVYLPSTSLVLAELRPERLSAVRALASEFLTTPEPDPRQACPGRLLARRTLDNHLVLTGTPLGKAEDPRWRYSEIYARAAKAVKEPARLAAQALAEQISWVEHLVGSLRRSLEGIGLTLAPTPLSGHYRLSAAVRGQALFQCASLPAGELLDLALEMVPEENRLRLRVSSLASAPLEIGITAPGQEEHRHRLEAARREAAFELRLDTAYTLRLKDAQGAELCRVPVEPVSLQDSLPSNVYLLLQLLGNANPVFFLKTVNTPAERLKVLGSLSRQSLHGDKRQMQAAASQAFEVYRDLRIDLPWHVFPVYEQSTRDGFVIPLEIHPAQDWQVSDAFGTFGIEKAKDPLDGLVRLLAQVEDAWQETFHSVLPARWLKAQTLRLACPAHIDLFEGESLQVPLLVAVLRALGGTVAEGAERLPFGQGPVFSTGTLEPGGAFGEVECVPEKLAGFVRELGPDHPALLTRRQRQLLAEHPDLLAQVQVIEVSSLVELLSLPELHEALKRQIQEAHHPSLNEGLLTLVQTHSRQIRFDEAKHLSQWLLSHVESPYYRFRLNCELALYCFHQGQFSEAARCFQTAIGLLNIHPELFGVDDLGRIVSILVNLAADACHPEPFRVLLRRLDEESLAAMTAPQRVKVYGALCQFHRFYGEHDQAIAAGRKAVALVDAACAGEAGRSRNYLVHALIVAYRGGQTDPALLTEAQMILQAAKTDWAPVDDANRRASHLGFCLHLEAEIARLRGLAFDPGRPYWVDRIWSHPWLFTLLSCTRNPQNEPSLRQCCIEELVAKSAAFVAKYGVDTLFGLFDAVYRLFDAAYHQCSQEGARQALCAWLKDRAKAGFPGWQDYLSPLIHENMDREAIEALCDAIRYH
jgi:tetratricopeptide (TPR) repeat protein